MWTREQLKTNAKMAVKRNYGACVAVALVIGIISTFFNGAGGGTGAGAEESTYYMSSEASMLFAALAGALALLSLVGVALIILIENVLKVGGYKFFILNQAGMQPEFGTVLDGFKSGQYKNLVLIMFMKDLFIGLWTCLFIIPGIVKSYEYMMVPYILAENPGMDRRTAFAISKQMMDGEKMNAFILDLSFIGWYILCLFTCGILAVAYVNPYVEATHAELYAYCKAKGFQMGFIR